MLERFPKKNLYELLGLPNFAPLIEVKKTYRELALINHPDRGGDLKQMQALNSIYDILTKHKDEYDDFLRQLLQPQQINIFSQVIIIHSWHTSSDNCTSTFSGATW